MMAKSTKKPSKGSPTRRLQKWQKNHVFEAIQAVGLDPREFDLNGERAKVRIKHKRSESYFIIGGNRAVGHLYGLPELPSG